MTSINPHNNNTIPLKLLTHQLFKLIINCHVIKWKNFTDQSAYFVLSTSIIKSVRRRKSKRERKIRSSTRMAVVTAAVGLLVHRRESMRPRIDPAPIRPRIDPAPIRFLRYQLLIPPLLGIWSSHISGECYALHITGSPISSFSMMVRSALSSPRCSSIFFYLSQSVLTHSLSLFGCTLFNQLCYLIWGLFVCFAIWSQAAVELGP